MGITDSSLSLRMTSILFVGGGGPDNGLETGGTVKTVPYDGDYGFFGHCIPSE